MRIPEPATGLRTGSQLHTTRETLLRPHNAAKACDVAPSARGQMPWSCAYILLHTVGKHSGVLAICGMQRTAPYYSHWPAEVWRIGFSS